MVLLERSVGKLTAIATGLSLAIANYRPTPTLNTTTTKNGNSMKVSTSALDPAIWGVPSKLVLPDTSSANSFKTAATVGPGSCPLNTTTYVPTGSLPSPTYAKFNVAKANIMRYREQISVNLGAWFVQEGWMQSEFMACAIYAKSSEYSIVSGFGTTANGIASARNYMENHWDTWITEDDFAYLASRGVNTVRLPIGYWSVGPYFAANSSFAKYADVYENSWKYVGRAINWAAKYDIGVLLDLHGAYGSQNGLDHSGKVGDVGFFTATNMELTTNLLTWLSWELADVTNIVGIELLNEPKQYDGLWSWYNTTADAMRKSSAYAKTLPLYIQDAYNIDAGVALVASRNDFTVVDNHSYFVFTDADRALSADAHISAIEGSYSSKLAAATAKARGNLVIGEWSCALDWQSISSYSDPDAQMAKFCQAELKTYLATTAGTHFWSYSMEGCTNNGGWCFKSAVGRYLPQYFNAWGLSGLITNRKLLTNSAAAIKIGTTIKTSIAKLAVPGTADSAASTAPTSLLNTFTTSAKRDLERSALGDSFGMAPLLASEDFVDDEDVNEERSAVDEEDSEDDLIEEAAVHRRGHGSISSRASRHVAAERRALTTLARAQQVGYSDGYLTATYFASAFASTTTLSRLGFQTQYIVDSWAKRVASAPTKYTASRLSAYSTYFKKGQADAEAAILAVISST